MSIEAEVDLEVEIKELKEKIKLCEREERSVEWKIEELQEKIETLKKEIDQIEYQIAIKENLLDDMVAILRR